MRCFTIIILSLMCIMSVVNADAVLDRQNTALLYHYNTQKYPTGGPRGNVVRAYCIFALAARGYEQITPADIAEANGLLEVLYVNWPVADETNGLYWMLPHLSRILAGDDLNVYLTPQAREVIKDVLYAFVYAKDDTAFASTDAANMWLVFESENHDLIRKQVFFTTAQAFKDDPQWAALPYSDGKTVAQHYAAWENYFESYFRERAKKGINIEVGSPTYAGVFLESIFIIYDLAENNTLKKRAGQFLNLYFADQAISSINGVRGGAKSRCYKGAPSYSFSSDKGAYYSWMLAGVPTAFNSGNTPYDIVPSFNSDYRLNAVTANLYDHTSRGSYEYIVTRPGRGTHTGTPSLRYTVAYPSMIRWYSWCTPQFILGSVTLDENQAYTLISDQNRWYGLVAADTFDSRIYFTPDIGDENNSYRDYIAVQHKGTMLIRKHKNAQTFGFRMFVSGSFTVSQESGWVFGYNSQSSVYFGAYAVSSDLWGQRYFITNAAEVSGKWVTFNIPSTTVIFESASAGDFAGFTDFKNKVKANAKALSGTRYDYTSLYDSAVVSIFTDTTLPRINGQTVALDTENTYKSPFLNALYDSPVISITDSGGNELNVDFTEPYFGQYLATDLNKDGYVNLEDIAFLATQWYKCTDPTIEGCITSGE